MERRIPTYAIACLLAVPVVGALPAPDLPLPDLSTDGLTARLTSPGSVGDVVWTQDALGRYAVTIEIFAKGASGWAQVREVATLRVFSFDAVDGESDRFAKSFTSSATAPVTVTFPASALGGDATLDVFVTFSNRPAVDGRVPTSHHSVQKNVLLGQGEMDLADSFDRSLVTRPIAG